VNEETAVQVDNDIESEDKSMIKLLRVITRKNVAVLTIIVVLSLLIACSGEPTESLLALEEVSKAIKEESAPYYEINNQHHSIDVIAVII